MQVAKQIEGQVVVADLSEFYPNTSFDPTDIGQDFIEQEGIFFIDNNLSFDPTTQKLGDVTPYVDGAIVRTKAVIQLTQDELDAMHLSKSGQVIDDYKATASRLLDEFAQSRGYDNIISVTTYINSSNTDYAAEAQRAIDLRDAWWSGLTTIMNDVLAGNRPLPASWNELAADLPELTWTNARPANHF